MFVVTFCLEPNPLPCRAILGVAGDDREAIRARVADGLKRDLLLVSGGVSAGDKDLVIPALEAAGVTIRMHKVRIKPGKPFCFAPGVFGLRAWIHALACPHLHRKAKRVRRK